MLNKQFYSIDAIKEAITDFEEICIGRIIDDTITVELEPKQETYTQLKGEFCNYVLGLMKNKMLI